MLFTIITVVFNDKSGLAETLESIDKQTCQDYEWVVIDGASTDGGVAFLQSLNREAFSFKSEPDKGIYDAMNKGIELSRGKYVVFLNAGDRFSNSGVLETVATHIATLGNNEPDLVLGGANLSLPNRRIAYKAPRPIERSIWHGIPANHQAIYFKRSRLLDCRYDLIYRICGDYYLVSRLFKQGVTASYLNIPLVDFRVGDTSSRNPWLLLIEPFAIQRIVLRLPLPLRCLSLFRRLAATMGLKLLSSQVLGQPPTKGNHT